MSSERDFIPDFSTSHATNGMSKGETSTVRINDVNHKHGNGGVSELKTSTNPHFDEEFEEFQESSSTFEDEEFSTNNKIVSNQQPFLQKTPEEVKQIVNSVFSPYSFKTMISNKDTLINLLSNLNSSNLRECSECHCFGRYKHMEAVCSICGVDSRDKERRRLELPVLQQNLVDSLKIVILDDDDEEEDYLEKSQSTIGTRIVKGMVLPIATVKQHQYQQQQKAKTSNNDVQTLPFMQEISQSESNSRHTDKYGFTISSETNAELLRKWEYINEENEKENKPKWDESMKIYATDIFLTKQNPLKQMIRKGIPAEYRTKVWLFTSGAGARWAQNKGYYKSLVQNNADKTSEHIKIIDKDIQRTLATNVFFREPQTLDALRRILVAFSWHNTRIGYCQGLGYIAGILLLLMKEESAFWLFCTIVEKLLPEEYFTETLIAARVDQLVFAALIAKKLPHLWAHFQRVSLNLNAVFYGWFICLFVNVLPVETILRIWDVLFNEGNKILFRIGLAMLKVNEKILLEAKEDNIIYGLLKEIPAQTFDSDTLLSTAFNQIGSFPMSKIRSLRAKFRPQVLAEFVVNPV